MTIDECKLRFIPYELVDMQPVSYLCTMDDIENLINAAQEDMRERAAKICDSAYDAVCEEELSFAQSKLGDCCSEIRKLPIEV